MNGQTRREFLRGGTAVAAGVLATGAANSKNHSQACAADAASAAPRMMPPDEPVRAAFIGIGGRGHGLLDAFLKEKGQEVIAVCDIDPKNLSRAAEMVNTARGKAPDTYDKGPDDFKRLLERKDLDAIVTATPCFEHARIMLATIQAGKHLYGEKPLGLTVAECDGVFNAAQDKPKQVVQVGFQWMANPKFVETVRRVHDGEIGEPIEGRFCRHNHCKPLRGWFSHREKSGDWMIEQAVHELNVMNWVAKATPLRAYGMGRSDLFREGDPERNVTDYYAAIIEYPNNYIVHYAHGWISPEGFTEMEQKVIGTKGAIEIGSDKMALRDPKAKVDPIKVSGGDDTQAALHAFLNSIRTGKPAVAPVSNGRNATLLGMLIRKAVYERRVVTWEEMLSTC